MRIAVGGIHIECSTFNPVLTHEAEFRTVKGDALLEAPHFQFLRDYPATFLPTLHTGAIPGGPVARETYEQFKAEFLSRLQAQLPIDGLYRRCTAQCSLKVWKMPKETGSPPPAPALAMTARLPSATIYTVT